MRADWLYGQNLIRPVSSPGVGTKQNKSEKLNTLQQNQSFAELLQTKLQDNSTKTNKQLDKQSLQFSKHAEERLRARSIQISTEQLQRIESGIDQIAQKGGKDSLVICGNVSLVVNIPNRTVITALDTNGSNNHVFTHIDSAVIV